MYTLLNCHQVDQVSGCKKFWRYKSQVSKDFVKFQLKFNTFSVLNKIPCIFPTLNKNEPSLRFSSVAVGTLSYADVKKLLQKVDVTVANKNRLECDQLVIRGQTWDSRGLTMMKVATKYIHEVSPSHIWLHPLPKISVLSISD